MSLRWGNLATVPKPTWGALFWICKRMKCFRILNVNSKWWLLKERRRRKQSDQLPDLLDSGHVYEGSPSHFLVAAFLICIMNVSHSTDQNSNCKKFQVSVHEHDITTLRQNWILVIPAGVFPGWPNLPVFILQFETCHRQRQNDGESCWADRNTVWHTAGIPCNSIPQVCKPHK